MAIAELERFREKYPQYNDVADEELAQRLAAKYPAYAGLPKKVRAAYSPEQLVERRIGERESLIPAATSRTAERMMDFLNPVRTAETLLNPIGALHRGTQDLALTTAAGGTIPYTAAANAALALQRGQPGRIFPDVVKGLRGEREATLGDVYVGAGVPEGLADVLGGATDIALTPGGAKGAVDLAKLGGRAIAAPFRGGMRRLGQMRLARPSTLAKPNLARETRLNEIRTQILKTPRLAGEEFETQLGQLEQANPEQLVDLSGVAQTLQDSASKNPAFAGLWNRAVRNSKVSAKVQSILNQPELASNVTIREAQEIKRVLSQALKTKFQQVSPELFDAHLDALDAWHGIRQAQVQAFPQFNDVAQAYHKTLSSFRTIKPYLKAGRLEPGILKNFEENTETLKALREVVTPETIRLIEELQKAVGTGNLIRRLGTVAGKAALGGTVAGTVFEAIRRGSQ